MALGFKEKAAKMIWSKFGGIFDTRREKK